AGIYYWWPKMTGRLLSEPLGKWHFWLTFLGMNVAFFPMHLIGLLGMPRRIYTYSPELGVSALNLVSTVGAFLIAVAILVFLVNVLRTRTHGRPAPNDPWGGATLEWSIPSPPPVYNFSVIPTVANRLPRWKTEHHEPMPDPPAVPPAPIHVPDGSAWRLFATALLGLVFLGGQVIEFTEFVHKGLTLQTNLFGCTFFVLTGTHGAHVTVGVLWLLTLWVRALQGKLGPGHALTVEITGLYWHFV